MKYFFHLLLLSFLFSCSEEIEIEQSLPSTPEDLKDHSAEFTKEVIEVTDGVSNIVVDNFNRDDKVNEILWFIYKLEVQPKSKGGLVHYLLGNHEYIVLYND